eukprot:scaffold73019_cov20-Prasinocladus_malaysianus.AAC.1
MLSRSDIDHGIRRDEEMNDHPMDQHVRLVAHKVVLAQRFIRAATAAGRAGARAARARGIRPGGTGPSSGGRE